MIKYLAALFAATIGFNSYALDDFDLYQYGDTKLKIERTEFIVKLTLFDTEAELVKEYAKVTDTPVEEVNVRAFTLVSPLDDVCYITIVKPKLWDNREALTIIGHELMHCGLAKHQDAGAEIAENKKRWEDDQQKKDSNEGEVTPAHTASDTGCHKQAKVEENDIIDTAVNVGILTLNEAEQLRKDIAAGNKDLIDVKSPDGILSFGAITYDDNQ